MVELDDGSRVLVRLDEAVRGSFALYVPPRRVGDVRGVLRRAGFSQIDTLFARALIDPWELCIRVHDTGFLEGEVRVSGKYVQDLGSSSCSVVYEVFEYTSRVHDRLHLYYKPLSLIHI